MGGVNKWHTNEVGLCKLEGARDSVEKVKTGYARENILDYIWFNNGFPGHLTTPPAHLARLFEVFCCFQSPSHETRPPGHA